jgi:hypothetical protein
MDMTQRSTYLDRRSKSVGKGLALRAFELDLRQVSEVRKEKLHTYVLEGEARKQKSLVAYSMGRRTHENTLCVVDGVR